MEGQQIQRDFGGSVWESNPPSDPRRTGSPALKAGKVTGPLSPPLVRTLMLAQDLVGISNPPIRLPDRLGVNPGVSRFLR